MIDRALKIWKEHAIVREGCRTKVYRDSLGKPTVGIGHLVTPEDDLHEGDEITQQRIDELFKRDTQKALDTSLKQCQELGIQSPEFLAALISVNFQLGDFSKKFKNSFRLLKWRKFDEVIENLENSLWAKQTPVRVNDFINAIRSIK